MKDFVVNITKQTKAISQKGFGLPLILGTSKESPYKEYTEIEEVNKDFGADSKEYKIAAKIFSQTPSPQMVAIYSAVYNEETGEPKDLVTALNTLIETNNNWYFLTCTNNSNDIVQELAKWTDTQMKVFFVTTQNLGLPALMENENTAIYFHLLI